MMSKYAPIAVFVYNRPIHTKELIESLKRNPEAKESDLFIFSDAAKISGDEILDSECKRNVDSIREYIESVDGFKKIQIEKRETNFGLANSIISGVSAILEDYDSIIVLEDDLIVSEAFLSYMNQALNRYCEEKNVYSITGYSFLSGKRSADREGKTYFLPIICSWSWATWRKKWDCFDKNASQWDLLDSDAKLRKKFNFHNSIDYYSMLKDQMEGKIDSWAIRWYWSVFKLGGLTLFPTRSYVLNSGFDGSGTHTNGAPPGGSISKLSDVEQIVFPRKVEVDKKIASDVEYCIGGKMIARSIKIIKKKIKYILYSLSI